MNTYSVIPQMNLRLQLPPVGKSPIGAIHTLIRDEAGNLYLSDEFNHRVISIDAQGGLRWCRGGKGSGPEHFWYPSGMALGWIRDDGHLVRCVAVCDSWNHRIQFFDLEGGYIRHWNYSGRLSLGEVRDLRFLRPGEGTDGTEGIWLILDRGNHRLCAMDTQGHFMFEIGQGYSPNLEEQWGKPTRADSMQESLPVGFTWEFLPYEPLYYPTRILGDLKNTLCVWEPISQRLKQVFLGNLFPIDVRPAEGGEWIAIDNFCLLCWSPSRHLLTWHNTKGETLREVVIEGEPIPGETSTCDVWVRTKDYLEFCPLGLVPDVARQRQSAESAQLLEQAGIRELSRANPEGSRPFLQALCDSASALSTLGFDFLSRADAQSFDIPAVMDYRQRLDPLRDRLINAEAALAQTDHHFYLGSLIARLLRQTGLITTGSDLLESARNIWSDLTDPLCEQFISLQGLSDELFLLRKRLQAQAEPASSVQDLLRGTLAQFEDDVRAAVKLLQRWSGEVVDSLAISSLPCKTTSRTIEETEQTPPSVWIARPARYRGSPFSRHLREVDRIAVGDPGLGTNACPFGIAASSGGDLFVSLFGHHQVLRLDAGGKIVGCVGDPLPERSILKGPLGVAVDAQERVWIVDFLGQGLYVWEPSSDVIEKVSRDGDLCSPVGIAPDRKGSMIVADTGNHRLLRWTFPSQVEVMCDARGRRIGELRHPISVAVPSERAVSSVWVVDQRNHRLKEFDADGNHLRIIGGCGWGRGKLVLPEFAAFFPDGSFVVSQTQVQRSLKLFSPEAEQIDCLLLDFAPGGLLVHQGCLYVSEYDGNHLRIFHRY